MFLLIPHHRGSSGQKAVKRLCVCPCVALLQRYGEIFVKYQKFSNYICIFCTNDDVLLDRICRKSNAIGHAHLSFEATKFFV